MTTCPIWARVPVAVLAGSRTPGCGCVLSTRCSTAGGCRVRFPVAPVGIAGVLVLVVGGTAAGFALAKTPALHFVSPGRSGHAVDPVVGDRTERRSSSSPASTPSGTAVPISTCASTFRNGVSRTAARREARRCRIPPDDTHRALPDLVRELRRQVVRLPPRHRPASHARRRERRRAACEGVSRRDSERARREPVDPEPAGRAGARVLPVRRRRGLGRSRRAGDGGLRVGTWRRVAGRRHSRHAVSPFDRRRRARATRAHVVFVASCSPARGVAARHRRERARTNQLQVSRTPLCPRSTGACSTTRRRRRSSRA